MRRILPLVAAMAILAVACGSDAPPSGRGRDDRGAASLLPEDRLALPELTPSEFQALLTELQGTPVVVNVWASWCAPCRVEAPELAELAREFEGDVQFLGVDIQDNRDAARNFILQYDWPYPSVFDPSRDIANDMGYVGQPVTIVYDREGKKTFEWVGAVTGDLLRKEIREVL